MTHILQPTVTLEELRRQLRENEITLYAYKQAERAAMVEPEAEACSTDGCNRDASRIERGRALCAVCAQVERNKRR